MDDSDTAHHSQPSTEHSPPSVPSCHSDTRETLVKYKKPELQKRSLELGLTNIWVRKDKLIDMILLNCQPNTALRTDDSLPVSPDVNTNTAPQDEATPRLQHVPALSMVPESDQQSQPDVTASSNPTTQPLSETIQSHPSNHSESHLTNTEVSLSLLTF